MNDFTIGANKTHILNQAMNAKQLNHLANYYDTIIAKKDRIQPSRLNRYNTKPTEFAFKFDTLKDKVLSNAGIRQKTTKEGLELSSFDSRFVQSRIRNAKANLSELDLLQDVVKINGDCNLVNTALENLNGVEKIAGNLLVDAKSKLSDLTSLKEIVGNVVIKANSEQEMLQFIKKTGLNAVKIAGKFAKA